MEYYKKTLCVGYAELTGGDNPVIGKTALNKLLQRKQVERHGKPAPGKPVLITYSSLPTKYQARWVELYGDPEKKMKEEMNRQRVKRDGDAAEFYSSYRYEKNGRMVSLPDDAVEELTLNASVLNALRDADNTMRATAGKLCGRGADRREAMACLATELKDYCRHTLPLGVSRLAALMKRYRAEGYQCLISRKYGNQNSLKLTDEAQEWLIATKRCRRPVLNDAQIFDAYNAVAPQRGWKPLRSINTLTSWFRSPAVEPLWYDAVYGELQASQRYSRHHHTDLPARRDSLWYGDGTKLNLYYRDERGQVRTINVYEVVDAYSEVLLGYHISPSEDFEAQYGAYRMALQVAGHKPYELVHDNQGGHKKLNRQGGGFLDNICHVHRPTKPYNGQSKTIENIFYRFQHEVLAKDWAFTGQNITAKRESSRPNLDFIDENKSKLPTLAELKARYAEMRREWNALPHPATGISRQQMYDESVNPDTEAVTAQDMVRIFWLTTDKPVTYGASGLKVTIGGRTYTYEVQTAPGQPDHEFLRSNVGSRFRVKYDPYDFGSIRLYSEDADGSLRFVRIATPPLRIHRAIQEQTEGEAEFIRREEAANQRDRIERMVRAKEIERRHGVMPEQLGLVTPRLKGVTAETQREIDRRTALYSVGPVEETQAGRVTKQQSNITWDELLRPRKFDEKKVMGKL
jgi:hypothetical protein